MVSFSKGAVKVSEYNESFQTFFPSFYKGSLQSLEESSISIPRGERVCWTVDREKGERPGPRAELQPDHTSIKDSKVFITHSRQCGGDKKSRTISSAAMKEDVLSAQAAENNLGGRLIAALSLLYGKNVDLRSLHQVDRRELVSLGSHRRGVPRRAAQRPRAG
jgi:hypothetical protein